MPTRPREAEAKQRTADERARLATADVVQAPQAGRRQLQRLGGAAAYRAGKVRANQYSDTIRHETIIDIKGLCEDFCLTLRQGPLTLLRIQAYYPLRKPLFPFSGGPYWLDLHVGSVHVPHYGVDEQFAREAAARFLLQYVDGIAPRLH